MSLKQRVNKYLLEQPLFRERKNKDRGLVNILIEKYPTLATIQKEILVDMVKDYNSMDRSWRQTLEHSPQLRGSDYEDKVILEQEKMLSLGYGVGHSQDIKTLKNIT
ncbi:MAG: hypothetical protein WC499_02590 [Patescibacteria group bacterium]